MQFNTLDCIDFGVAMTIESVKMSSRISSKRTSQAIKSCHNQKLLIHILVNTMSSAEIYIGVLTILFCSTFVRSSLGFGDALVAMPLMTMLVGLKTATPTVALVAVTIAMTILVRNWRIADLKAALGLIIASCIGIPIGLILLKGVNEDFMKALLGIILVLYGMYSLVKPRFKQLSDHLGLTFLFGFVAGVLGGAYNANGPSVVIYGTLRKWAPSNFRATLQGYFLPTGFFIAVGHGISGLWTARVFTYYAVALPAVFLAIFLGGKVHQSLSKTHFDRYIHIALIAMGIMLVTRAFL
jgi:hypothetical protein